MEKTSKKDRVYITPVKKEKQDSFLNFLRNHLKIEKQNIKITSNGHFYFFNIDLSDKSDEDFGKIRKELNEKQLSFVK